MTSFIKSVVGAATIALFLAPGFASATGTGTARFNDDPLDHATVRVSNYTKNPGCNSCWSSSVSADPGDIISVSIYYHNTSNVTARNVTLSLNPRNASANTAHSFNGSVRADNAATVSGSASVTLPSAQTLTFLSSQVFWYPNQTQTPAGLPFGQTGEELFSGNFRIGDIGPGWATQGSVVARFQVGSGSNNPPPQGSFPVVETHSADTITQTSAIIRGFADPQNSTDTTRWFEWGQTQSLGNTTQHFSQTFAGNFLEQLSGLASNTTYYFRAVAQNSHGTVYGSILSFTTSGAPGGGLPSVTTNSATNITQSSVTLNGFLNANNTTNVTRWFEWGQTQSLGQSTPHINQSFTGNFSDTVFGLSPNATYYFRAVAQNSQGTVYGSILSFSTGFSGGLPLVTTHPADTITQTSAIIRGFVDPQNTSNTTRWFEWGQTQSLGNTTQHFSQTFAGNFLENIGGLSPNTTYYFRAVAQNSQGTVYGSILSFSTGTGGFGQRPIVQTLNAEGVSRNFALLRGSVDPRGSTDTTRWFEWGTNPSSLFNTTTKLAHGTSVFTFTDTITGLSPNTTYYFRAVAQNSQGISFGGILSFNTNEGGTGQPFVSTSNATNITQNSATLNCFVNPQNNSNTTRWFEWGTTQSLGNRTITLSHGSVASNASETIFNLTNNTTYYFRCVAQSSFGTSYGSILSFSTGAGVFGNPPTAITNLATNIDQDSARLNGVALIYGNAYTTGWFEWGTNQSLGFTTTRQNVGSITSTPFYASLFNLTPNTTYYFRAVVENQNGTNYGTILSFRTNSVVTTPPPSYVPPTVTPPTVFRQASITKSLENIDTQNGTQTSVEALRGDIVRYTIEVRNTGTATLNDVEIKDRIPFYLEFANAKERLSYDDPQREVVWFMGSMTPGEMRRVTLDVVVTNDAPYGTVIDNVARVENTHVAQTSNTATIRVTDRISGLAGAALLGGSFLPDTLLEWLLLVLVILGLILASRKVIGYYREGTLVQKAK